MHGPSVSDVLSDLYGLGNGSLDLGGEMTKSGEKSLRERAEEIHQNTVSHLTAPGEREALVNSIETFAKQVRNEALEEAAQIADRYIRDPYTSDTATEAENIRNNILSLKSPGKKEG